ncbi:MAG: protein kinase [Bacteroidales bacterium]|nr:protein kinase [Bacteroidales bacterium]
MQTLAVGTTLQNGKYKILGMLGQGGFGITYLAEQTMLSRKVAIKEFFMKDFCNREESTSHVTVGVESNKENIERFKKKFAKEARNIAKLNHKNIVSVIDIFEENATAYYVMDYVEGGSLSDMLKERKCLSETDAKKYIFHIADAIAYMHSQKMMHLDIKPANILINENDEAILIDFGLSKQYNDKDGNSTSTTPGGISEGYAPIEQYSTSGMTKFSPASDVYSLAATYFKLLTGNTPPPATAIGSEGVPVNELIEAKVTKASIEAICNAMKSNKTERTQSVSAFINALTEEHTDSDATEANTVPLITNIEKPAKTKEEEPDTIVTAVKEKSYSDNGTSEQAPQEKSNWLLITVVVAIIVACAVGLYRFSTNNSEPLPDSVTKKTIVLTKGPESKRNFVYTGKVDTQGLPHGKGHADFPETKTSGSGTFDGTFEHGFPSEGEMNFANGTKFKGTFTADGFFKQGKWTEADGFYFEGTYNNGEPHNGKWYTPQGVFESEVVNGK